MGFNMSEIRVRRANVHKLRAELRLAKLITERKTMAKIKYTLPTSSPWIVVIDGQNVAVSSDVARLLLQLERDARHVARSAAKKKAPAAKKKAKK